MTNTNDQHQWPTPMTITIDHCQMTNTNDQHQWPTPIPNYNSNRQLTCVPWELSYWQQNLILPIVYKTETRHFWLLHIKSGAYINYSLEINLDTIEITIEWSTYLSTRMILTIDTIARGFWFYCVGFNSMYALFGYHYLFLSEGWKLVK